MTARRYNSSIAIIDNNNTKVKMEQEFEALSSQHSGENRTPDLDSHDIIPGQTRASEGGVFENLQIGIGEDLREVITQLNLRELPKDLREHLSHLLQTCSKVLLPISLQSGAEKDSMPYALQSNKGTQAKLKELMILTAQLGDEPLFKERFAELGTRFLEQIENFRHELIRQAKIVTKLRHESRALEAIKENEGWNFVFESLQDALVSCEQHLSLGDFDGFPPSSASRGGSESDLVTALSSLGSLQSSSPSADDKYTAAKRAILEKKHGFSSPVTGGIFSHLVSELKHKKALSASHPSSLKLLRTLSELERIAKIFAESKHPTRSDFEKLTLDYFKAFARFQKEFYRHDESTREKLKEHSLVQALGHSYSKARDIAEGSFPNFSANPLDFSSRAVVALGTGAVGAFLGSLVGMGYASVSGNYDFLIRYPTLGLAAVAALGFSQLDRIVAISKGAFWYFPISRAVRRCNTFLKDTQSSEA